MPTIEDLMTPDTSGPVFRFLGESRTGKSTIVSAIAVSDAQRALKPGNLVHFEDDLGQLTTQLVRSEPGKLSNGIDVIWLQGKAGCVSLCRCHPVPVAVED